jgi:hypothetical protein
MESRRGCFAKGRGASLRSLPGALANPVLRREPVRKTGCITPWPNSTAGSGQNSSGEAAQMPHLCSLPTHNGNKSGNILPTSLARACNA